MSSKLDNYDKNDDSKNKIIDINDLDIITNGTLAELKNIDPNQIGHVVNSDSEIISEITPLIMIINQNSRDMEERIAVLTNNGADMDLKIKYYNQEKSARDIYSINN